MRQKYLLLHNFETDYDKKIYKELHKMLPESKILNYAVFRGGDIEPKWKSFWIPEEQFMIAWTFINHKPLKNGITTFEEGYEYMSNHQSDENFHKYSKDFQEIKKDNSIEVTATLEFAGKLPKRERI
jgi:L-rhamnose mutarotase